MWIMWIMWINKENEKQRRNFGCPRQEMTKFYPHEIKKYPQAEIGIAESGLVDNVENYIPSRFSPIFSTSPAPIVINRSPFMQFSSKNFSISLKVGK